MTSVEGRVRTLCDGDLLWSIVNEVFGGGNDVAVDVIGFCDDAISQIEIPDLLAVTLAGSPCPSAGQIIW